MDGDWARAMQSLSDDGWARLTDAIDGDLAGRLASAAPGPWAALPPEEGVVRQGGYSCGAEFDTAAAVVRQAGDEITSSLGAPTFNEVNWTRNPPGAGFITAHRDPPGYGGVIAVATLTGQATFRLWSRSQVFEWQATAGDLVLLTGKGWPTPDARSPVHEAEPPVDAERLVLTFRHNRNGAGAEYFVEEAAHLRRAR
jgi:hypothetical protein